MDEIIKKILSSPVLTLPPGGCRHLQSLISYMQNFTIDEFKRIAGIMFKLRPDSPLNQPDILKNIEAFIEAWAVISQLINDHYEKILSIWKRLHDDSMGADYNLPILIKLLPSNTVTLRLFATKLDEAMNIFTNGKLGYTLVDFSAATEYKLRTLPLKKSPSCPSLVAHTRLVWLQSRSMPNLTKDEKSSACEEQLLDKYEKTALIIEQDLKRIDLVKKYHSLLAVHKCYLDYLNQEIYNKLSTESPDIYAKYSLLQQEERTQHIINELRANPLISDALNKLIEKRICMDDFSYTLHSNEYPVEHVLTLFAEKFSHFKETMEFQPNKFIVSLKSIHSYYMLFAYAAQKIAPISNAETAFNNEAAELCAYLNGVQPETAASAAAAAAVSMPNLR